MPPYRGCSEAKKLLKAEVNRGNIHGAVPDQESQSLLVLLV